MSATPRRLIVGGAGSLAALGIVRSVRRQFGDAVFIVAMDTNPRDQVAAAAFADAFVQVPMARSVKFHQALSDIAAAFPHAAYLPTNEYEIDVAAHLAAAGELPDGMGLVMPPHAMIRLCNDKWAMHHWLLARGFPSPATVQASPDTAETIPGALFLKPRNGYGSKGVRPIHDTNDVAALDPEEWLIQERLSEPVVTIEALLSRADGRCHSICRLRLSVDEHNVQTEARVFQDRVLADLVERIARALPLYGAFCLQVMASAAGDWKITDVNPRLASGTGASAAAGMDFVGANLADFWGDPVERFLQPMLGERYVVRRGTEYSAADFTAR